PYTTLFRSAHLASLSSSAPPSALSFLSTGSFTLTSPALLLGTGQASSPRQLQRIRHHPTQRIQGHFDRQRPMNATRTLSSLHHPAFATTPQGARQRRRSSRPASRRAPS